MVVLIAKLYYNCITTLHKLKYKKISITENVQSWEITNILHLYLCIITAIWTVEVMLMINIYFTLSTFV